MPQVQSPARSSICRCTDVVGAIAATGLHVATAGNLCALHFYTPHGTTIVRIPLAVFIEGARGPRDGNGKPYPKLTAANREQREHQLAEDAAATRPLHAPRCPALDDGLAPPSRAADLVCESLIDLPLLPAPLRAAERLTVIRRAWALYTSSPTLTHDELARKLGCKPGLLRRAFEALASLPGAPVLKPNGKL